MLKPATIILTGRVGIGITADHLDRQLRTIGPQPLHITLRSEGGCCIEANRIYHRLREHAAHHLVEITAVEARSAGSWIFLAGDERCIAKNGSVMLHNVLCDSLSQPQTPTQLRERAASLEAMTSLIGDIYHERTGLDRERVFSLMESEVTMNAARAVELGFAHSITDPIY